MSSATPAHPDPHQSPPPSPLDRRGRPLLVSNLLDAAGREGADLAVDVLAVTVLGATATQMGLLNALGTLAFLVLGIPIGVLVDRSPTVRLLVGSGLVRTGLLATLVIAWAAEALTLPHLYAVAALTGVAAVVTETTQTALAPRVVGAARVSGLVARMQSAESIAGLVLPAAAGAGIALAGGGPVLAVAAAVIALAALTVLRLRTVPASEPVQRADPGASAGPGPGSGPEPDAGGPLRRFLAEARAGWTTLRGTRALWRLTLGAMVINLGLAVHSAVEVLLVLRTLDLGPGVLGLLVSAGAAGALLGSLVAVPLSGRLGVPAVLRTAVLALAPVAALTLAALLDPDRAIGWLLAGSFLWGLAMVGYNVLNAGLTAQLTPGHLMGRVSATRRTLTLGIVPAGSLGGGVVADVWGIPAALVLWLALTAIGAGLAASAPGLSRGDRP